MIQPQTPKLNPELVRKAAAHQAAKLFPRDIDQQNAFLRALLPGKAGKPSLIWMKDRPKKPPFATVLLTEWQPAWVDTLAEPENLVGELPMHADGAYYLLDFSNIISASVLLAIKEPVTTILDLCSAPGGKGIFASRLFEPKLLICNEVIGKRQDMLEANLERCHISNSHVTQSDPAQFSRLTPQAFDLVIVDAPCSSQTLTAKGTDVPDAFESEIVSMNVSRQRRILANAAEAVRPGGHLAYMTSTYSREENEKNLEWLLRRFPQFKAVEVPHLAKMRSNLLPDPCYRHWPQDGLGVGGFACLLQNTAAYRPGISRTEIVKRVKPIWSAV